MAGEATPNSLASIEKKERAQMARNNEKRNPLKPKTKTKTKTKERYVCLGLFQCFGVG